MTEACQGPKFHRVPRSRRALVNSPSHAAREPLPRPRRWLACALVAALAPACAPPTTSARAAAAAFVATRAASDPVAALYAMLPSDARRDEPLAAFRARMERESRSLAELRDAAAAALRAGGGAIARTRSGGTDLYAVDDASGWHVAGPPLGSVYPVAIPGTDGVRAALEQLRLVAARGSVDALLGMLTARARGAVEADLAELARALSDPGAARITGDRPTRVRLSDGRTLLLVWEDGAWHIDGLRDAAP